MLPLSFSQSSTSARALASSSPVFIIALFSVIFIGRGGANAQSPQPTTSSATAKRLVLFHSSDIHGYIRPHKARWHKENPHRMIGGFAALAALVKAESAPTLLLDSGDLFQGAPEGSLSRGRAVVTLMNRLGYRAAVIGNHEYDFQEPNLEALVGLSRFPFLAANIYDKRTGERAPYSYPRLLLEVGDFKIGVVGLATVHTKSSTLPSNVAHLDFRDEVSAARPHVAALRAQGAELVIALTHCGLAPSLARQRVDASQWQPLPSDLKYQGDLQIARNAGVDLVLGGHVHAALSELWRSPAGGAWIAQSGEQLEGVTRILIERGPEGARIVEGRYRSLWLDEVGEDPEVKALVERLSRESTSALDEVIGEAAEPLPRFAHTVPAAPRLPGREEGYPLDGPLLNLSTDAMAEALETDFALQNTFGLRDDIGTGEISLRTLFAVMPFENTLVKMSLTGAQVEALLLHNFEGRVSRLQVSEALRVDYHPDPSTGRAASISISLRGEPIERKRSYQVTVNSYMAEGGSCCAILKGLPQENSGRSLRLTIRERIERERPLNAPASGRLLLKEAMP